MVQTAFMRVVVAVVVIDCDRLIHSLFHSKNQLRRYKKNKATPGLKQNILK